MAIYANGPGTVQTTAVTTSATQVWNTSGTNIPTGAALADLTIENIGSNACYVGGSSVSTTTGLRLQAGAQVTIRGYTSSQGTASGNVYAICSSGALTTVVAGLATLDPVA